MRYRDPAEDQQTHHCPVCGEEFETTGYPRNGHPHTCTDCGTQLEYDCDHDGERAYAAWLPVA
jgi:peptide subunit release factor 1 (eRF1)